MNLIKETFLVQRTVSLALTFAIVILLPVSFLRCSEAFAGQPLTTSDRPNILFIYADDLGWKDTSFMGSDFFETPHLDRLARGGIVFNAAYSCGANCAPSRASLLTGQYTPRHQIFNVGTRPRGKLAHRRLQHVPGTNTLDANVKTWAQQLQGAGYRTAIFGKWHLSDDPIPFGFDHNVGGTHSGGPPSGYYPPHRVQNKPAPGLQDADADEHITGRLAREAIEFIEQSGDEPWLVYLPNFAVHTPIQYNKSLKNKYENKAPGELHNNPKMATMIQSIDDGVGEIVAALKRLEQFENTVIIFSSDNGGHGPVTDMAPLKGYKGTFYEGGIRVPFFVHWPGVVAAGAVSNEPITGVDLFPTLCEIAGVKLPEQHTIDGVSLVPVLSGEQERLEQRDLFWHFPAYLQTSGGGSEQRDPLFRTRPCSIIRSGKWKLHQYFESGDLELYDLDTDIGEQNNVAGTQPDVAAKLLKRLEAWRKLVSAPVPIANPEFDAVAEKKAIQKRLDDNRRKSKQN